MKKYHRMLSYLRPYVWPWAALAIASMLLYSAVEGAIPFLAKYVHEQLLNAQQAQILPWVVIAVAAVSVVRGEIVESGTHEELLARGAEYWKLHELQFGDADAPAVDGEPPAVPARARLGAR